MADQTMTIESLKQYPQWVCFTKDKKPINPHTGYGAKANDASTWASYDQARKRWASDTVQYAGTGYELVKEQKITGGDLDKCIDDEGNISPYGQEIVKRLNSYTEYSPSGRGLHIWVLGEIPDNIGPDPTGTTRIEMYDHARYFTITGNRLPGTPETIEPRQEELTLLYREVVQTRKEAKENARKASSTGMDTKYGLKALETERKEMAGSPNGSRNAQLNRAAYALGQLVSGNELTRATVERALTDAALATGLEESEIEKTLRSGLESGMKSPRSAPVEQGQPGSTRKSNGYEATDDGMAFPSKDGLVLISNFSAEILADVTTDDGAECTRSYEIEAVLRGKQKTFEVKSKDFAVCNWIDEHLGARAWVTTGQSMKSHLINAIKECSDPDEHFNYAHTGWRNIDGTMVYLHAGGCLSRVSRVGQDHSTHSTQTNGFGKPASKASSEHEEDTVSRVSRVSQENRRVRVKLTGALSRFSLPDIGDDLKSSIRSSLRILDIAADTFTVPLYTSLWRSVLGEVDYGVHVAGQSGLGKTAFVALLQQHFGQTMDATHLPGSWESTDNALEMQLFQAKDTLLTVDDFKPRGGKTDQDRLHAKADRIFRQIGNGSARGRLNSNLEARPERRPRCLLISTGEDVPRGQSLKARAVVLTMVEGITEGEASKKLSAAQKDARSGVYAQAMAHYIQWLVPQIEDIQTHLPDLVAEERDHLSIEGHARSGTNTANMLLGMQYFLRFACECGAIDEQEASAYLSRCVTALHQIARDADSDNKHDKPSEQWRRLLIAAIANKSAHLVGSEGGNPGLEYGWVKSIRTGMAANGDVIEDETFRGGGSPIGWIDGDDIYLQPAAAYKAARSMGSQIGDDITTLEPTLRKFLLQDGLLASTSLETARKMIPVRRRLEKVQREVLHVKKTLLYPDDTLSNLYDSLDSLDSEPPEAASEAVSEVSRVDKKKSGESSLLDSEPEKVEGVEIKTMLAHFKKKYSEKPQVFWTAPKTGIANGYISPKEWYQRFTHCYSSADLSVREAAVEALKVKVNA